MFFHFYTSFLLYLLTARKDEKCQGDWLGVSLMRHTQGYSVMVAQQILALFVVVQICLPLPINLTIQGVDTIC